MRNLAIECSGLAPGIGVFEGDHPLKTCKLSADVPSVRAIAPTLAEFVGEFAQRDATNACPFAYVGVTVGPGSFTGLRVGIATAKMLAMAWNIPLVAVDTLHAIAFQQACVQPPSETFEKPLLIVPVMNAFRRQVFTALWRFDSAKHFPVGERENRKRPQKWSEQVAVWGECLAESCVMDAEIWRQDPLAGLQRQAAATVSERENDARAELAGSHHGDSPPPAAERVVVVGPGLEVYRPVECDRWKVAPQGQWEPKVEIVAKLAWAAFAQGATTDALHLMPNYVRASAAEEKATGEKARLDLRSPL